MCSYSLLAMPWLQDNVFACVSLEIKTPYWQSHGCHQLQKPHFLVMQVRLGGTGPPTPNRTVLGMRCQKLVVSGQEEMLKT